MNVQNTTVVEIVQADSPRDRELRDTYRHAIGEDFGTANYVRVGQFRNGHVRVVGYRNDAQVYLRDVTGSSQWEPGTRNQIGGLGASRDLPPTDAQVAEAVERATAAILSGN